MNQQARLPAYPLSRNSCPLSPPQQYGLWRETERFKRVTLVNGSDYLLVTRHEDACAVLTDPRFSPDRSHVPEEVKYDDGPMRTAFILMDDPEHAHFRRMLTRDFMVRRSEEVRGAIRELVAGHFERLMARTERPVDFVAEYALPLPALFLSLLLGVPPVDRDSFVSLSTTFVSQRSSPDEIRNAGSELRVHLEELAAVKSRDPGDDTMSRLIAEFESTGHLTRDDVVNMCALLMLAGHESMTSMIAMSVFTLLREPEQLAAVHAAGPEALGTTVEELLRYLTVGHNGVFRVANVDVDLGGHVIRAGQGVVVNLAVANRDRRVFHEPDDVDPHRDARRHLAFGWGMHRCLGSTLARVQLQEALLPALHRLPGLRLAVPADEVPFYYNVTAYGISELPVEW
ncbi:cytochrome P450 [Streptomyces mayteni]